MGTTQTHLQVVNNTNTDIVNTSVSGVDGYDFDRGSRPDRNFQGVYIGSRQSVEHRQEVKNDAKNCPFNMTLHFRNGLVDTFRIHQKYATGCCPGFQHIQRSHNIFHEARDNKVIIKVENTDQQLQNEKAEERNKEGEAAMRQKQYETAMRKFDEALRLANQSSTISSVKNNKSSTCNEIGKACLQKAWELEANTTEDKSQQAKSKFDEARSMFQQGQSLCHLSDQEKNLNVVTLKIDGNRLFNEGNELEKKAFELFENARKTNNANDYNQAQNVYKEASDKYQEAKKKFKEGAKLDSIKFDDCVKIAAELITETTKVVDDIDKVELGLNMSQVTVDEKKDEKEDPDELSEVNKNLQEQVDVEIN